jgi:ubiquinone/menaquinone biosynthesis C-methylase UbiE
MIVAGGGTGGVTAFVAEQLNHTNAEVVYIDFSNKSMKIAQRKARNRNLNNIIWIRSWIEDVRYLGMGVFEELQCSGVLHHLKSPSLGLNILKDCLITEGKMGLLVYAKYGRTGVYQVQRMMKMINYKNHEIKAELQNTNNTLEVLPEQNWFLVNPLVSDHKNGNIGIYDLLLHKRDVAYSIQTLFEWIERAGLHFVDFDNYAQRFDLKAQYVFDANDLIGIISKLDRTKQLHVAEVLQGSVIKQQIYASKTENNVACLHDPSNILYISGGAPHGFRNAISNKKNYVVVEHTKYFIAQLSRRVKIQNQADFRMIANDIKYANMPVIFNFKSTPFTHFLLDRLLRSKRGIKLKTLYSEYRSESNLSMSNDEFFRLTEDFYNSVRDTEVVLLRDQRITQFPKTDRINLWQINSI